METSHVVRFVDGPLDGQVRAVEGLRDTFAVKTLQPGTFGGQYVQERRYVLRKLFGTGEYVYEWSGAPWPPEDVQAAIRRVKVAPDAT